MFFLDELYEKQNLKKKIFFFIYENLYEYYAH